MTTWRKLKTKRSTMVTSHCANTAPYLDAVHQTLKKALDRLFGWTAIGVGDWENKVWKQNDLQKVFKVFVNWICVHDNANPTDTINGYRRYTLNIKLSTRSGQRFGPTRNPSSRT